jgi:hypothetical protein
VTTRAPANRAPSCLDKTGKFTEKTAVLCQQNRSGGDFSPENPLFFANFRL